MSSCLDVEVKRTNVIVKAALPPQHDTVNYTIKSSTLYLSLSFSQII